MQHQGPCSCAHDEDLVILQASLLAKQACSYKAWKHATPQIFNPHAPWQRCSYLSFFRSAALAPEPAPEPPAAPPAAAAFSAAALWRALYLSSFFLASTSIAEQASR